MKARSYRFGLRWWHAFGTAKGCVGAQQCAGSRLNRLSIEK
nr:MAG TPA: hypothetical protein [Caudoviricetes sp.]